MKKTAIVITVTLLLGSLIAGAYLFTPGENLPTHRQVILLDRTDEFEIDPSDETIDLIFSQDEVRQARSVVIRPITELATEDRITLELNAYRLFGTWDESWYGHADERFRKDQIAAFESQLDSTISSMSQGQVGYQKTSFLMPFVKELEILSEQKEDDRTLIVFGDLAEHSSTANWLKNSSELRRLAKDDRSVWEQFGGSELDLSGIKIVFIFRPSSGQEDAYVTRSTYLKNRLTEQGASVHIQARETTINF